MNRADFDRVAAEYVLGLLEGEEAREAERLAESDGVFATNVAEWQARLSELDATATALPAPEALWRRIEDGLAAAPAGATAPAAAAAPVLVPDPRTAFAALWRNLAFWRFAGLAGAAAALVLAVSTATFYVQAARKPVLIAVLVKEGTNQPGAVVNAFAGGRAELIPLETIAVPPGRALEIWTLWDRARGPVSIGLIDQARTVQLNLQNLPREPNQLFEISLEPSGGSPTGRPTGPVLMKGTTAATL